MLSRCCVLILAAAAVAGCTTIREISALRSVAFRLDHVAELRIAGIDVSRVQKSSELSLVDAARVATAVARQELPLSFRLHVVARNPESNAVTARLVRMRWTLFLEDTETISGQLEREYALLPGQATDIPIDVSLDLLDFYERSGQDLIELALNLAGAGGEPKRVAIRAVPTIDTPLGAISYPRPITIVAGSVGRAGLAQAE
jgi:hypothetical protein